MTCNLEEVERRLGRLETVINELKGEVGEVKGKLTMMGCPNSHFVNLLKFVVLPLLIIVGGLVGVKLV